MSTRKAVRPATSPLRTIAGAALLLVVALAAAGCSDGPPATRPVQDAEGRYVIEMTAALTFEPAIASVPVGATVVWVNVADSVVHDVAGYRGDPIEEDREEFSSFRQPPDGLGRPIGPGGNFNHEQAMKGVVRVG
jgi:plastocyanin